jgi:hypothetical protein
LESPGNSGGTIKLLAYQSGIVGLHSIFLEKMHNRRLMRTAAVAAAAPPRCRAFLASAPAAGAHRDARS